MIYFDNSATTRVDERVIEEMSKVMSEMYLNVDSAYTLAYDIKKMIKNRKNIFKKVLGLNPDNFSFTSGGGEANNLALTSVMRKEKKGHLIISKIEHPSLLNTALELKNEGYELDFVNVDEFGNIDIDSLRDLIREDTRLVSIMGVNNEIGTIMDMENISKTIKSKNSNTYFHIDFVQGLNHVDFDFSKIGVDILSISSHKIHGPKGIGAIYIKDGVKIKEQIYGSNSENKYIPRTMPNELVMGFLKAIEIGSLENKGEIKELKKYFLDKLSNIPNVYVNSPENSSDSIVNVSFIGAKSEVLQNFLSSNNIFISVGSACSSNKKDSHVLKALNISKDRIESAIRVSFSKYNSKEEIDIFFKLLTPFLQMLRSIK
ncbi:cysteine desulfurase family protein [Streptobacillus moniliformis]|uniref:cysteine desulfurase family protein n=1 Tax=Streptobacillus moniliformis TaxID=34105 RepID=UPI0007E2F74C|nr:cysteine desulfurase family protein [Streptobacillus moniliformis]